MLFSDREQARDYIIHNPAQYLRLAKDKKSYVCPICGSGTGKKGTGITTKDNVHFTCWAGCFSNSDIIDIIGLENGLTAPAEKFSKAYELYDIEIEEQADYKERPKKEPAADPIEKKADNDTMTDTNEINFTDFLREANKHIKEPAAIEYLKSRGISLETAEMYRLGYVEEWRHPKAPNYAPTSPRIIVPISQYSYFARDMRKEIPAEQKKYDKSKAKGKECPNWLFNRKCITNADKPIIICEGEFDALSILEAGGEAVSLGSLSEIKQLLDYVKDNKPAQPLLISLDNDAGGQNCIEKLVEGLNELNIENYVVDICGTVKDANDALVNDRDTFIKTIQAVNKMDPKIISPADYEAYKNSTSLQDIDGLLNAIETSKYKQYISTGLNSLDKVLDGGLRTGLYVVGAISSLGKTTFCLQLISYMAKSKNDVLMFSLEMSKNEIIAKSISRETMIADIRHNKKYEHAKSTLGILDGKRHKNFSDSEKQIYEYAIEQYKEYAGHIRIIEGVGNITVNDIKSEIDKHIYFTGNKPIVLIDYMQILARPKDIKYSMTDKQVTDSNVVSLRQLCRDYDIPIIGISSFNRESYTEPVSMAAFKESGAIEYSADVLIGLQYEGMDYDKIKTTDKGGNSKEIWESTNDHTSRVRRLIEEQTQKAKSRLPQQIECKILKNRNGNRDTVQLDFYPVFNRFTERDKITGNDTADKEGFNVVIDEENVFDQEELMEI